MDIHTGESMKDADGSAGDPLLFDARAQAERYILEHFGEDAGRDYAILDLEAVDEEGDIDLSGTAED